MTSMWPSWVSRPITNSHRPRRRDPLHPSLPRLPPAGNGHLRKSVCAAVRATPGAVAAASCARMNYSARSRHRERFEAKPDEHCHLLLRRLRLQAAGSPCERHSCRTGRGRGRVAPGALGAIRYRDRRKRALFARADARVSDRGRGSGPGSRSAGLNRRRMVRRHCEVFDELSSPKQRKRPLDGKGRTAALFLTRALCAVGNAPECNTGWQDAPRAAFRSLPVQSACRAHAAPA